MAANTISTSFVEQFGRDVHLAYQRLTAKLRPTVRQRTGVVGYRTRFNKMGTATASQKARLGEVQVNNIAHTNVWCNLEDWYSSEMVERLDELKIDHDERGNVATLLGAALNRKDDALIIAAMEAGTTASGNQVAEGGTALTIGKVRTVFEAFGDADVPDDGNRWWLVSPAGWADLMNIDQFANADYIGADLPYPQIGYTTRRWFSFNFMMFSGLPKTGDTRSTFAYHSSAVGHAAQALPAIDITWQGKNQGHLFVQKMATGSVEIDANGLYEVDIDEAV